MKGFLLIVLWSLTLCPCSTEAGWERLWSIGLQNQEPSEFGAGDSLSNSEPGSPLIIDDDFYLAGEYPAPIGIVSESEPLKQFPNWLSWLDPTIRVHFPLTASQATATASLTITLRYIGGGYLHSATRLPAGDFGNHDLQISFNRKPVLFHQRIVQETWLSQTFSPAAEAPARLGENVIEIRRVAGSAMGYLSLDFVELSVNPQALSDEDGDGIPQAWEIDNGLSDLDSSNAAQDIDEDGLSNWEEWFMGTDPRQPDSDSDGLNDGTELFIGTDPTQVDTDGDTLSDGLEVRSHSTDPSVRDTDGDGLDDNVELGWGLNPTKRSSAEIPTSIALNFVNELSPDSQLPTNALAGKLPQSFWNSTRPVSTWTTPSNSTAWIAAPIEGVLVDSRGAQTGLQLEWDSAYSWFNGNDGSPESKLFDGLLLGRSDRPARIQLSRIPYAAYDLIIYVGGVEAGTYAHVELEDAAGTPRFFATEYWSVRPAYVEGVATQQTFRRGNFVHYRSLTNSTISFVLQTDPLHVEGAGVHGFQIVDMTNDGDSDGLPTAWEAIHRLDTTNNDAADDPDGDGLSNLIEWQLGTDPHSIDSDGDGLKDGVETSTGLYLDLADTGSNPLDPDTDADGVSDGQECLQFPYFSDPNATDTDQDGFTDLQEREALSNPNLAGSSPANVPEYSAITRSWFWEIDHVQLVWNHRSAAPTAEPLHIQPIFSAAVFNQLSISPVPDLEMGLRFNRGKVTWFVSSLDTGAFFREGPVPNLYDSDFSAVPQDLSKALGFSGFGDFDTSDSLRFSLRITQSPTSNRWHLSYEIRNLSTSQTVVARELPDLVATPEINDGTAVWGVAPGSPDTSLISVMHGVTFFQSVESIETRLPRDHQDADGDGMPDLWEVRNGFDPRTSADPSADQDRDGLSNIMEYLSNTDPLLADSDGDGAQDTYELFQNSNPLQASSLPAFVKAAPTGRLDDVDRNDLSDFWEFAHSLKAADPRADLDKDGASNYQESIAGTNPNDPASVMSLSAVVSTNNFFCEWQSSAYRSYTLQASSNWVDWFDVGGSLSSGTSAGRLRREVTSIVTNSAALTAFRLAVTESDSDGDMVPDWVEKLIGTDPGRPTGSRQNATIDSNGDGRADGFVWGDAVYTAELLGSGNPGTTNVSRVQAARLLAQATFGPTLEEIERVRLMGIEAWIDDQIYSQKPYLHQPYIEESTRDHFGANMQGGYLRSVDGSFLPGVNILSSFARGALQSSDQLRQRMAFALSQILVISRKESDIANQALGLANYYDILVRNAFGNYRDILTEVSLHPMMGRYLSHVGNQKATPEVNQFPDENYSREIMQLFSIGLWKLNPDGTRQLREDGSPIPTYSNDDITQIARVFTGLWYPGRPWRRGGYQSADFSHLMTMHASKHDFEPKSALEGMNVPARPATQENAMKDVQQVIDYLFNHPNTPVFICRQLIQFLVTFNPSPGYVQRVQNVFVDNGAGTRGDLAAVVRAILTDEEARDPKYFLLEQHFGKIKEPVIRVMSVARALRIGAREPDLVWWNFGEPIKTLAQEPLNSPTVFNFYRPDYVSPGKLGDKNLVAPVLQITDGYTVVSVPNDLWELVEHGIEHKEDYRYSPDFSDWLPLAVNTAALLDRVNLLFCQGTMAPRTRELIRQAIEAVSKDTPMTRIKIAIYLAACSPDGVTQR
jgi:uncharacterized protein (DUF1800 family)